jgi:hypothetical protein
MSVLPAVGDELEAEELVRELFRNPSPAALALATPHDSSTHDAVLRYLRVALQDLPSEQAAMLRHGAAALLDEPELTGHVAAVLSDCDDPIVGSRAAAAATAGALRGLPVHATGGGDLHALLLGLCARFDAPLPVTVLARDAVDPCYRDLALLLLSNAEPEAVAEVLPAAVAGLDAGDEYTVEALGRALQSFLRRRGEAGLLHVLASQPPETSPLLLAGLREALEPRRLAWLSEAQQRSATAALERQAASAPDDALLRLRLHPEDRAAFLAHAADVLGSGGDASR